MQSKLKLLKKHALLMVVLVLLGVRAFSSFYSQRGENEITQEEIDEATDPERLSYVSPLPDAVDRSIIVDQRSDDHSYYLLAEHGIYDSYSTPFTETEIRELGDAVEESGILKETNLVIVCDADGDSPSFGILEFAYPGADGMTKDGGKITNNNLVIRLQFPEKGNYHADVGIYDPSGRIGDNEIRSIWSSIRKSMKKGEYAAAMTNTVSLAEAFLTGQRVISPIMVIGCLFIALGLGFGLVALHVYVTIRRAHR